jgi:diguanylate cyclase (GGDEF)-like protein/PAS domain S-box-containing protein
MTRSGGPGQAYKRNSDRFAALSDPPDLRLGLVSASAGHALGAKQLRIVLDAVQDLVALWRVGDGGELALVAASRSWLAAGPALDGLAHSRPFAEAVETAAPVVYEQTLTIHDQSRTIEASVTPVIGSGGRCGELVWVGRDVTQARETEHALRASEERFRLLAENAQDVVSRYRLAPNPGFDYVSPSVKGLLGYSTDELYADAALVFDVLHPDDREKLDDVFGSTSATSSGAEVRLRHKDGRWIWVDLLNVPIRDANGVVVAVEGIARDITERKTFETELAHRALHDALTGLPNRALVLDRLGHAGARLRVGERLAVLLLDVDRFKLVNETYGQPAGDQLLVELGRRLAATARPGDTVGRFAADEFVVLCEGLNGDRDALGLAERLMDATRRPFEIEGRLLTLTTSIGIATSNGARPAEDVLQDADAAMYRAKERGRDRYEVFDEAIRTTAVHRLETEAALRRALDRGELRVHYQPAVAIETGQTINVEALVRWEHPEHGLVLPGQFISLAEETGLIVPIGEFVLREACRQAVAWPTGAMGSLTMAVNVSARQLADDTFVGLVAEILAEVGLAPELLCLEITESAMVDGAAPTLQALRDLGVRLSIDDFGTGYSSLLRLKQLPVDQLKVDRSFVAGLGRDPGDTAIVAGVVGLARALGLAVVAEGVEGEEQVIDLRAMGCELAQGFYWCKPLPADDLHRWLTAPPCPPPGLAGTATTRNPDRAEPRGEGFTVVVVDDVPDARALLRLALETFGPFHVIADADNASDAVECARRLQPDLVLLDLALPGASGLEALPEIIRASPRTQVVILSGFVSPSLEKTVRSIGALAYFDKRIPPAELVAELVARLSPVSALPAS